jgi:hypothetical protein
MSALASLINVECVECRRKGHRCQAQMWVSVDDAKSEPVCLRCADGEACCFETAQAVEAPAVDELDVFTVPVQARLPQGRREKTPEYILVGTEERAEIIRELKVAPAAQLALRHGLPESVVRQIVEQKAARNQVSNENRPTVTLDRGIQVKRCLFCGLSYGLRQLQVHLHEAHPRLRAAGLRLGVSGGRGKNLKKSEVGAF